MPFWSSSRRSGQPRRQEEYQFSDADTCSSCNADERYLFMPQREQSGHISAHCSNCRERVYIVTRRTTAESNVPNTILPSDAICFTCQGRSCFSGFRDGYADCYSDTCDGARRWVMVGQNPPTNDPNQEAQEHNQAGSSARALTPGGQQQVFGVAISEEDALAVFDRAYVVRHAFGTQSTDRQPDSRTLLPAYRSAEENTDEQLDPTQCSQNTQQRNDAFYYGNQFGGA
ncbi:hypothetical protein V866_008683 [Kwoniella sp. B9012]